MNANELVEMFVMGIIAGFGVSLIFSFIGWFIYSVYSLIKKAT